MPTGVPGSPQVYGPVHSCCPAGALRPDLDFSSRWKGENVATTEVADTVGLVDFVEEVNVYGVSVPGMHNVL